ncbi:HlyC/CorC family transporter [Candidatus Hepatincola sp. Pdp]
MFEYYEYFVIGILLLLSCFFSAAETAITASSKSYLLHKDKQGVKTAKILNKLLKKPDNIIISLLVGNNFANILFTTIVTALLIPKIGIQYTLLLGISITFIILIFAEILPKTYTLGNPNKIVLILTPLIYGVINIIKPLSWIFITINKLFLFLSNHNTHSMVSLDNLRGAIEMLEREEDDTLAISQEKEMLHSILDLNDLSVAEIMNHRKNVFCINLNDEKEDIIKAFMSCAYSRIPVYKESSDNIVGIIRTQTFYKSYLQHGDNINIEELILPPYFIPTSTYVIDLLTTFKEKRERMALIVDEYGSFMGILTLGDILEEITGDLKNQEQTTQIEIQAHDDGYIVSGDLKIRDLNRKMGWNLPDEEFTTVAGLILYETGRIPNVGNIFIFHNFKFQILEKKRHQLIKIKVSKN